MLKLQCILFIYIFILNLLKSQPHTTTYKHDLVTMSLLYSFIYPKFSNLWFQTVLSSTLHTYILLNCAWYSANCPHISVSTAHAYICLKSLYSDSYSEIYYHQNNADFNLYTFTIHTFLYPLIDISLHFSNINIFYLLIKDNLHIKIFLNHMVVNKEKNMLADSMSTQGM